MLNLGPLNECILLLFSISLPIEFLLSISRAHDAILSKDMRPSQLKLPCSQLL